MVGKGWEVEVVASVIYLESCYGFCCMSEELLLGGGEALRSVAVVWQAVVVAWVGCGRGWQSVSFEVRVS